MVNAYLAPLGLEDVLASELKHIIARHGRLFLAEEQKVHWAQNIWKNVQILKFRSIKDAANKLRLLGALWAHYPTASIRRARLITEHLPHFAPKPLAFLAPLPTTPIGSWTLLDDETLLCSAECSSPFAHGEMHFHESKEPPSRAYLKLWEFFTCTGHWPRPNDKCLELGASPGSWTWVLQQLGASVIAVDRSPLQLQNVTFLQQDAFSLTPNDFPDIQWLFSDLICYPEKLYDWLQPWLERNINLICTLKFQGSDYNILKKFEQIPNSTISRLYHNKHELMWYSFAPSPKPR